MKKFWFRKFFENRSINAMAEYSSSEDKLQVDSDSQTDLCDGFCQECDWVNLDNFDSVNEKLKELEPILHGAFRVQK